MKGYHAILRAEKQVSTVIEERVTNAKLFLGDYIRQRRLELGLTQEQVCEGICEPITLSRIENGKQTPSRVRINAILQRLDLPDDRYYALLTKNELEIEALEKEIVACNATGRAEEGFKQIEKLKAFAEGEPLIQQFIIRSRLLLEQMEKRYTEQEEIEILTQAIRLTVPDFNTEEIEKKLYTRDEIKIINQIANAYSCAGNQKKAADIFYQLLKYIRKHIKEAITSAHLMHSIGHFVLEQNPDMKVIYVTSESFTNEVIESIRSGNAAAMTKLRDKYRTVDVLMIDDIQFIIGKESTQEEFFHTFNVLHAAGKQIVLSSDKPPKEMETLDERFRSRFEWGLIADIQPPDYETRMAILRKNAENYDKKIDDSIFQYIATNIKSNIRELEGAFNRIIAKSKIENQPEITMELAEDALKDIINPDKPDKITPELIIRVVAEHYGVNPEDITSKKRNSEFVLPRQVVMYLCRDLTETSLANIGKLLGKKDHTTVIHGANKITDELNTNEELKNNIEIIKKKICV